MAFRRFFAAIVAPAALGLVSACAVDTEDSAGTPHDDIGTASDAVKVCAAGDTVKGIDVSHWNGTITWSKVYAAGYRFAIMKASEGTSYVDPTYETNWAGAKKAGLLRGAYHFFRPSYDGVAQAKHFVSTMGTLADDDLPPVCDLEVQDGVSDATVIARLEDFLTTVEKLSGRKPMIYTGYFFTSLGSPPGFSSYPLWVAHWGVTCPNIPSGGWKTWTFWQNTDKATVSGIGGGVDADMFNGTLQDLIDFAKGPDQKVQGSFDSASCDSLAGWAWDPDTASKALSVSIYADGDTKTGTLVTQVSAGDKRDDLCTAIGSCNHGFSVALPDEWLDGQTHSLEAYATGDQGGPVKLSGGPKSITCDTPVTGSGGAAGAGGAAGSAGSDTGGTAGSDTGGSAGTSSGGSSGSTSSGKKAGSAGSSSKPTPESGDSGSCSTSSGSSRKDPALALLMVGALFGLRRRRG